LHLYSEAYAVTSYRERVLNSNKALVSCLWVLRVQVYAWCAATAR
jgi:hypothetical protein